MNATSKITLTDRINKPVRKIPSWTIYAVGLGWMVWLFWQGITNQLGPEPVKVLEHSYGKGALQWLIAGLAITPLRVWTGVNLIKHRRAVGLVAFYMLLGHLLIWAILDVQSLERVWADIVKRPYITVGMAGFLLLVPLAVTSNDRAVRWLGARWRKLHKLVFPALALGALHFIWLVKGWQIEPFIYAGVIGALVVMRLPVMSRQGKRVRMALN